VILVSHDRDFLDRTVTSVLAPDGGGRWIEYAGGYSDMLAQRGGQKLDERKVRVRAASDEPATAAAKVQAEPQRAASRKLSYKQKFALESLPKRMEAAAASIAKLEAKLADPRLFSSDPAAFSKTAVALEAERAALAAMEHEWLELEMLREAIEG
jgi:ABC transport system ATP-binding/permease protein